ncbi:Starch-binding associating with outer membrane [Cnuella takakiae]|uniref:Starch-binding associating with outer membrane n=2 Tax=Cnuella takakiae TaxID=1302690 RepID=A0A1M5H755_9BACT|nr:Starch-binding associating with outer membrane [Cnuella takakiae]
MVSAVLASAFTSCTKDLDRLPKNEITSEQVYANTAGYKQAFAKVYGAFALTGNQGPAGNGDIQGIDEGFSDFLRLYWKAQELPTEEAVIGWGDAGLPDFHNMNWGANNPFLQGLYYRCFYQITLANDFIRQSSDANLSSRGISGADADEIRRYRNEARFLRAYQYSVLMDLFGNVPFVTEADALGSVLPKQATRAELFTYVETELKELETLLADPKTNEYGRADKAAAWALLARNYLNAEVFTGTQRNTDAVTYSKKVIDAGFTLEPNYRNLMLADNQLNRNEFILTINYDGLSTQSYGGTTFLVHAAVVDNMDAKNDFGIPSGGWFGLRTTKSLVNLFPDADGNADKRAQFQKNTLEINDISKSSEGYGVRKFRNVTRTGAIAPSIDAGGTFVSVDFPIFRLAEQHLIYAEATLRGGTGGNQATALQYINALRTRAGAPTVSTINTDFILDERARELYWEGFRRTDLIRYNRFTEGSYLWPFKGGVKEGRGVESFRKLYPIPTSDLTANPNLKQNTGY